jgi:hypothetical protein
MTILGLMMSPFIDAHGITSAYGTQKPKRKGIWAQAEGCCGDGLWGMMYLTDLLLCTWLLLHLSF